MSDSSELASRGHRARTYVRGPWLALWLSLPACAEKSGPSGPTYEGDIAPLLEKSCVGCHRPGAIGPFPLTRYEEVVSAGPSVQRVTRERTMPPTLVDNSGECGSYADVPWLSDTDVALIGRWVDAGMPRGAPSARPEASPPDGGVQLEGETITVSMAEPYLPAPSRGDEYRCFRVPVGLDRDVFVTGFEALPGNRALAHHITVWAFDPDAPYLLGQGTNAESVARLDAADPRAGWDCLALDLGVSFNNMPVLWTPGTPITRYPAGTGLLLRRGEELVFQMHYHSYEGAAPDRTAIRLAISESVAKPAQLILTDGLLDTLFAGQPFVMPPGARSLPFTWEGDLEYMVTPPAQPPPDPLPASIDIHGVYPHMHTAGARQHAELLRGTQTACAMRVPRYDFDWQQMFFYQQPLRMNAGDRMRVTCEYDTSTRTGPTLPGFQTSEEMCTLGVFISLDGSP